MSSVPDHVPDWLANGGWSSLDRPPDDLEELWPDDVLTEQEWERGWFNRKLVSGEVQPSSGRGFDRRPPCGHRSASTATISPNRP
jgi:hypothetical protein